MPPHVLSGRSAFSVDAFDIVEAFADAWLSHWARERWPHQDGLGPVEGTNNAVQLTRLMLATGRFREHLIRTKGRILNQLVRKHMAIFNPGALRGFVHLQPAAGVLFLEALKMVSSGDDQGTRLALDVVLAIEPSLHAALSLRGLVGRPDWGRAARKKGGFWCGTPPRFPRWQSGHWMNNRL